MSVREIFEEIWPVPDGVNWNSVCGYYVGMTPRYQGEAIDHNLRLDTFTRCQESMFSKEEVNLFRQWFNAVEDLSSAYLEKSDFDLYRKVMERLK